MIKVALTGAGSIAKVHAVAIRSISDLELVAVVDRSADTARNFAQEFNLPHYFESVEELIQKTHIDALVICTPNYLHCSQALTAILAGVHVMVEKPMAMDANEALQMLNASQQNNSLLMVAHCWRFDPEVIWLRNETQNGRIGKIIRTKGYGVHTLWGPSGWFIERRFAGGGAMADMGIHAIDTTRFLLGDPLPESVYARIDTHYIQSDVDDTGIILVNWVGGAISYIEAGWWQPHSDGPEAATQLYGTKGFGQIFPTYIQVVKTRQDPGFKYPRTPHGPQSLYNDQMSYFSTCIKNHIIPNPGGMEGWINMKIVDAAYESSRSGKVIKVE